VVGVVALLELEVGIIVVSALFKITTATATATTTVIFYF
jgi:hypothetical protein